MSLAELIKKSSLRCPATATVATSATNDLISLSTVATVATVAVAKGPDKVANDPASAAPNPTTTAQGPTSDSWCWPNSTAANDRELDRMQARLIQFDRRGLAGDGADRLVDLLLTRDREGDERRSCLECRHCSGRLGALRCANHRAAHGLREMCSDFAVMLRRCAGFAGEAAVMRQ